MVMNGKTGNIHGIEVKARAGVQLPTQKVNGSSADGRKQIVNAAKRVYEQHHAVIQALAKR